MAEKNIKSRIVHKHDTESNWSKATTFIPKQGEIIIYDIDSNHSYERFKIGDGITKVNNLPFADANKVDKISGKGLSTNDYTTAEKNKLASIAEGANKTIVDSELSSTSTDPVQNKVVNAAINDLNTLVGDTAVATQISNAVASKADASHTHDDRYYTESEIDTKLSGKSDTSHTHSTYVNQNAFSNIKVGNTTVAADTATDTVTLVAGNNITITPDATNDKIIIAATDTVYTHPSSGVTAGTYKSVTVNAQGHVTGGSNPTTLSGYGITDAATKSALTAVSDLVGDTAVSAQISDYAAPKSHTHNYAGSSSAGGAAKVSESDIGITTAGTGSAYTATVPGITALASGVSFIMVPHVVSSSTTPTLNVNSLGAKNIKRRLSSISTSVQSGYSNTWLAKGTPFRVTYDGTQWIVEGLTKPATADLYGTLSVEKGGTGATSASDARTNLGITPANIGAAASSHTHSYLPLSGGTVTGALTVNKELYSNAAIISKRNSSPQLILQNANGAQLGSIYSGTSDGSYSDVLISVNSSSSDVAYFGFAKNGQFTAPNNIYSKGTLVSQTNSYPGLTIQNTSGANLAMLYSNGTTGEYSNAVLRVYSSASAYSSYSFGNDGTLDFGGALRSGNHTIKGNSYPALSFTDTSVNKTFAYLQPQTSAGDYADVLLAVKNSSGQSNFLFAMNGDLTIGKKLYNPGGQVVKRLGLTSSGTNGYIKFATINLTGTTYQNQPIRIAIAQRGRYGSFKLRFASVNSADPAVEQFVKTGQIEVYIHKSATSVWDLYLHKSEAYDDIDVTVYENGSHNSFKFTWVDTLVSALPSGYITASEETWSGAAASANTLNNTLAISKGGTGATTASGALTNLGALSTSGGTVTGILTVNNTLYGETIQTINEYVGMYENNRAGKIDIGNATYGDWTTIACSNDGSVSISNMLRATALRVDGQNDWPSLYFKCSSKTNPGVLLQASSNHGFGIYCYGSDLDSASTRYYEGYTFPAPATGLTANKSYTVYSEKNIIYSSSQPAGVKGAIWLKPV